MYGHNHMGQILVSVEIIEVVTRYPRTIGRNAFLGGHGAGPTAPAVILGTDGGAYGWGIVGTIPDNPSGLVGRCVDELFDPAIGVIDNTALWADVALHDLVGVLRGQPVYQMLGARGTRDIPVYDASIYFDDLDPELDPRGIDAILENVLDGWDDGYRAFKLKIGRGYRCMPEANGLDRDVEVTRIVHDAFPEARLLVDGNNGFTVEGFLRYLDRVCDVGLFWVEEPFHEHREGLQQLRRRLDATCSGTLIADGEYQPVVDDLVRYARDGLLDVLLMDVIDYGLTAWRRLSASLEGSRIQSSPHTWGLPLKTVYAAHLAAGLPGVIMVEAVRGKTVGVDTSRYAVVDGVLKVPDDPGFGIPVPAH